MALLNNGVWSSYGSVCNVTLPGTAPTTRQEVVEEDVTSKVIFTVKGYQIHIHLTSHYRWIVQAML